MSWVGSDLKDYLVPARLQQARFPATKSGTRSGCPGPYPTWLWPAGCVQCQLCVVVWRNLLSAEAMGFSYYARGIATETGGVMTIFVGGLSWTDWLNHVGDLAVRTLPDRWKHFFQTNSGRCDMNYKINEIFGWKSFRPLSFNAVRCPLVLIWEN